MKYILKKTSTNDVYTGKTLKELSKETNITQSTLYRIKSGKIAYKKNNGVGKYSDYQISLQPKI